MRTSVDKMQSDENFIIKLDKKSSSNLFHPTRWNQELMALIALFVFLPMVMSKYDEMNMWLSV